MTRAEITIDDLLDEMSEPWTRVERAIWPDGPASGHGSGEYAALKGRIIATLRAYTGWRAGLDNPRLAIEEDRPLPDSIADIAAEHGVTEAQLRTALREAHPDAGVAEIISAAREIA